MRRLSRVLLPFGISICLSACARAPRSFRLVSGTPNAVLIPPGVRGTSLDKASVPVKTSRRKAQCSASPSGLRVQGHKVVVSREALLRSTAGEINTWTAQLEEDGCVTPEAAALLPAGIIDALPLELSRRRQLQSEPLAIRGSVELSSVSSLRVVSPVFRPGAAGLPVAAQQITKLSEGPPNTINVELRGNPDLTGYEVAWYDVVNRDDGPGLKIVPRSAEVHVDGKAERAAAPRVNHLAVEPDARWMRYFLMTRASQNDYNIVVVTGKTRSELESRTASFRQDAAAYLGSAPKGSYAAMTREIGVNPYLRVTVNGVVTDVPASSSLRQVLEQVGGAGTAARFPKTLTLRKLHRGMPVPVEWDRSQADILELPIEGGEEINW
jgi:hypothetical protein